MSSVPKSGRKASRKTPRTVALYHRMFAHEGFEETAKILFELVKDASKKWPRQERMLFLDVDGHRNKAGGYDHDAYEIMQEYLLGSLGPYLTEIWTPLIHTRRSVPQLEQIPDELLIRQSEAGE